MKKLKLILLSMTMVILASCNGTGKGVPPYMNNGDPIVVNGPVTGSENVDSASVAQLKLAGINNGNSIAVEGPSSVFKNGGSVNMTAAAAGTGDCLQLDHRLLVNRVVQKGVEGWNVVDVVDATDQALTRNIYFTQYLNGTVTGPTQIFTYKGNEYTLFAPAGYTYTLSEQKTCLNGTQLMPKYNATFTIPSFTPPDIKAITTTAFTDHIDMNVPLGNNYAMVCRYQKVGTTAWYTLPGQQKVSNFTVTPLSPGTQYKIQVTYISQDRVTSSAWTELQVSTLDSPLSPFVFGNDGTDYFTFNAPTQNLSCRLYINGVMTGIMVMAGTNKIYINPWWYGIVPPGTTVEVLYFGKLYSGIKK